MNRFLRFLGALLPCAGDWWESEIVGVCRHGAPWGSNGFPTQPVNAYSNVAYPAVGWGVFAITATPESIAFALTMTALGVGSFLYHAWPTVKTAKYDHAGMYAVFLALTTYAVGAPAWAMWVSAGVGAYLFRYAFHMNLNVMMGLFLWLSGIAVFSSGDRALGTASGACFVTAMLAWQLDRHRVLTGRYGHGIWHVLTALAIGLMFLGV